MVATATIFKFHLVNYPSNVYLCKLNVFLSVMWDCIITGDNVCFFTEKRAGVDEKRRDYYGFTTYLFPLPFTQYLVKYLYYIREFILHSYYEGFALFATEQNNHD